MTWKVGAEEFTSSYVVTRDLVVMADVGNITTVTFIGLDGTTVLGTAKVGPYDTLNSEGATIPDIGSPTAKYFNGSNKVMDPDNDYYNGASSYTYYAHEVVTITFYGMNADIQEEFEFISGKSFSSMGYSVPTPEVSGNISGRWLDSEGNPVTISTTQQFTQNTSYYANGYVTIKFLKEYTDALGVYVAFGDYQEISVGGKLSTVPTPPTEVGYEFIGWYDQSGNPITVDTNVSFTVNTNAVARYQPSVVTVTFLDDDGTELNTMTIPKNGNLTSNVTAPTKMGYKFKHWIDEEGTTYTTIGTGDSFSEDTTFTAVYDTDYVSVSFDIPDSDEAYEATVQRGGTLSSLPEKAERDGYTCAWYIVDTDTEVTTSTVFTEDNTSVELRYTERTYSVTYTIQDTEYRFTVDTGYTTYTDTFSYTQELDFYEDVYLGNGVSLNTIVEGSTFECRLTNGTLLSEGDTVADILSELGFDANTTTNIEITLVVV